MTANSRSATGARSLLIALALLLPLHASEGDAQAKWVVKIGTLDRAGAPLALSMDAIGAAIDAAAPGRFEVKRFPDGALSRTTPALDRVQSGEVHAYAARFHELVAAMPELASLAAPFVFDSAKDAHATLRRGVGSALREAAAAKGLRIASIGPCEMRAWASSKPDALTAADLAALVEGTLGALVASPSLPGDAQIVLSDHAFECGALVLSQRWLDGLPAEMRKKLEALPESVNDAAERALKLQRERLIELLRERGRAPRELETRERRALVVATRPAREALEGEPGSVARRIVRSAQAQ